MLIDPKIYMTIGVILMALWLFNVPLIIAKPGSADFRKWMTLSAKWMGVVGALAVITAVVCALDMIWS